MPIFRGAAPSAPGAAGFVGLVGVAGVPPQAAIPKSSVKARIQDTITFIRFMLILSFFVSTLFLHFYQ
jgi:hypothetical protein